jgi:4,5-dihydroxyphthalate decarboxylase
VTQTLTFACVRTDRTEAFFTGAVKPEGINLAPLALTPPDIFPRALRRAEFDVTELSASSYLVQLSRGTSEYVALPVFLSRSFRFDSIYVRGDSAIAVPSDLAGCRMGTPEFQMTAGVWARGILQDHFGVDPRSMTYVTAGLNLAGRRERIKIDPAPGYRIEPAGDGETLDGLLKKGAIDAVMAPEPPASFLDGSGGARRLFGDVRAAEAAFFKATHVFPIMHLLAVRKTLIEAQPELARSLYDAFVAARDAGYRKLAAMARATSLPLMLPFLASDFEETTRALGKDFWPYGITANRPTLEALCQYSHDQGLSARPISADEMFVEALLNT